MLKKIKFCIFLIFTMVMFGGCSKGIELTEEETDMFAEYISKEVLERDKYYDQALIVPKESLDPEGTDRKEDTKKEDTKKPVNSVVTDKEQNGATLLPTDTKVTQEKPVGTLDDLLSTDSIDVSYASKKVYSEYSEANNDYFVIHSPKGTKLVVVKFKLKNKTDKATTFSMLKKSVDYKLEMETGSVYSPLLTLLENDLQFFDKKISSNDTDYAVLVFRVKEQETKTNGILHIQNGTMKTSVEIN